MDKAKQIFIKIFGSLRDKWKALSKTVHIVIIAGISVVIVSLIILAIIMSQTGYKVLYTTTSASERSEVLSLLQDELGASDVKVSGSDILVREEEADGLSMQLSIQGYPKSSFDNSVWNTGVSIFSSDTEKRELQRQQLMAWLMAAIDTVDAVDKSYVILNIPKTQSYVISTTDEVTSASVIVHLKEGRALTSDQIDGIYNIIQTGVPNLLRENITLTDGDGQILYVDNVTATDELSNYEKLLNYKLEFRNKIQKIMKDELDELFNGIFTAYNLSVSVDMTFGDKVTESTTYTPSVEEEGTQGGMVSDITSEAAAQGTAVTGGEIGTTVDSDISPDYPTVTVGDDGTLYYDTRKNINYLVNTVKEQYENDGFEVKGIYATVAVDETNMTQADVESWQKAMASALGTTVEKVSFIAWPFAPTLSTSGDGGSIAVPESSKNTLILLIICIGAVLVLLLIIALVTSNTRKKRQVRAARTVKANMAAAEAGGGMIAGSGVRNIDDRAPSGNVPTPSGKNGEPVYEIPSLLETTSEEAREAILKREIKEFSKANPEIVAQLIRNWMKGED